MAERRMLTRKITDNDNFVELPATAQALYLHLTMNADDDGFCSQIATAMFRAHAKKKDLELLVEKRYLIRFENGVMVIKHWRMANSMRKDRYEPTVYQEEATRLTVKPNGAYTLATDRQPDGDQTATAAHLATNWQPDGNQAQPQVRLGQDRLNNNIHTTRARANEDPQEDGDDPDGFEAFWAAYPRKTGDTRTAYFEYLGALQNGAEQEVLIAAARALAERTKPEDFNFIPSAEKWLRNKGWLEQEARKKVSENGKRNGDAENAMGKQYNVHYDVE